MVNLIGKQCRPPIGNQTSSNSLARSCMDHGIACLMLYQFGSPAPEVEKRK